MPTEKKPKAINWDDVRCLTWDDFKGEPADTFFASAVSYVSISYDYDCVDGFMKFEVDATFDPNKSWVKDYVNGNSYLLNHEQRHFDITKIYADKMEYVLNLNPIPCFNEKAMYEIANLVLLEWKVVQDRYDRQTQHSLDEKWQNFWDWRIDYSLGD